MFITYNGNFFYLRDDVKFTHLTDCANNSRITLNGRLIILTINGAGYYPFLLEMNSKVVYEYDSNL